MKRADVMSTFADTGVILARIHATAVLHDDVWGDIFEIGPAIDLVLQRLIALAPIWRSGSTPHDPEKPNAAGRWLEVHRRICTSASELPILVLCR